jgi:hypothetical protein
MYWCEVFSFLQNSLYSILKFYEYNGIPYPEGNQYMSRENQIKFYSILESH